MPNSVEVTEVVALVDCVVVAVELDAEVAVVEAEVEAVEDTEVAAVVWSQPRWSPLWCRFNAVLSTATIAEQLATLPAPFAPDALR